MIKNYTTSIRSAALIIIFSTPLLAINPNKIIHIQKLHSHIQIDGIIDPVWANADSVSDFNQYQPYHGRAPSEKTTAKLFTTGSSLYCLIVCYNSKKPIEHNTGMHDWNTGDVVSLMLDTFGDKRTAYTFAVTASGVRNDSRLLDDARDRDGNWDGVWFADAKVYEWGYVVEMEIPYRTIQYDESKSEWGIDIDRWIPGLNEDIYWCAYEESEGQRVSKFGTLVFDNNYPSVKGLNLEIYPVGISKAIYLGDGKYKIDPDAGVDMFYNPSKSLTFQLTANPDFAQIEADPFSFNISRYETYFSERRPFFTTGNEVFMASGRQRNMGFYRPLELFYSRRIGKKLPDGREVPLLLGTRAFGRITDWEYGGFLAVTGQTDYLDEDDLKQTEPRAYFGSGRIKKQIFDNSSIGALMVAKKTPGKDYGVIDIDGAFRESNWQLAYQFARSFINTQGDYAGSLGYTNINDDFLLGIRSRYVGKNFDISQVGYVPWAGTAEFTSFGGPRWYYKEGYIQSLLLYTGFSFTYKDVETYTDRAGALGLNMQFRDNWGYELTAIFGKSKDEEIVYDYTEFDFSTWMNPDPKWSANFWGSYVKTYNFSREYLAFYTNMNGYAEYHITKTIELSTNLGAFIEGNPQGKIEDVTYNARPSVSVTPVNDVSLRLYVDNVYVKSTQHMENVIAGFLFSYNFLPKSWIYFAVNEIRDRSDQYDTAGNLLPARMHTTDRVAVLKLKYLYYF